MRQLGIQGVRRGKQVRTTRPDSQAGRHSDLVDRAFAAERPNALWVTDLAFDVSAVKHPDDGCAGRLDRCAVGR